MILALETPERGRCRKGGGWNIHGIVLKGLNPGLPLLQVCVVFPWELAVIECCFK